MKRTLLVIALLAVCLTPKAQTIKRNMKNLHELSDRVALKELVDTFSILADKKDVHTQVQLFTADATSETFIGGNSVSKLTGRKQLEDAFGAFLATFETVYHFNGQQKVNIAGDKAIGTSYCTVTLISTENGKKMKTTIGVVYEDEFVRENGHWLIANRKANFDWQEKRELAQ